MKFFKQRMKTQAKHMHGYTVHIASIVRKKHSKPQCTRVTWGCREVDGKKMTGGWPLIKAIFAIWQISPSLT